MNINDIGLNLFSWVKRIKGNNVDLDTIRNVDSPKINHDDWTRLLGEHVSKSGQVNYKGFIENSVVFEEGPQ